MPVMVVPNADVGPPREKKKPVQKSASQIAFQQELDAAEKQSWQHQAERQAHLEERRAKESGADMYEFKYDMDEHQTADTCVVLVENLHDDACTQDHLLKTMAQFGQVVGCAVHQRQKEEPGPTWGLVAFETPEEAAACLAHIDPRHETQKAGHVMHHEHMETRLVVFVSCVEAITSQRRHKDPTGDWADMWESLCTLQLKGIVETACTEEIVCSALKLDHGVVPKHATVITDYVNGKVVGNALVTFRDVDSMQQLYKLRPMPKFHSVAVDVFIGDLEEELESDFAFDDPRLRRIKIRLGKKWKPAEHAGLGSDVQAIADHIRERDQELAAAFEIENEYKPSEVAMVMCRRLSPTHSGHEYWCSWDGNVREPSWESREFLMKDPQSMGMVMELDERLDAELSAAPKEAIAIYEELDIRGIGEVTCSEMQLRLHDYGLHDEAIECLVYQLDTDHNGMISRTEFAAGFQKYKEAMSGHNTPLNTPRNTPRATPLYNPRSSHNLKLQ